MVNGGTYCYEYHLKDHLGNTRVAYPDANNNGSIEGDEILQVTDYYPFGMRHEIEGYPNHANQKYLYNGKELQEETGWYDYGTRMYDTALGRWHVIDPMAVDYYSNSPYNYVANNPLKCIDSEGMWITSIVITEDEDEDGNIVYSAYLVVTAEEGDNAETLAEFLGIEVEQASLNMKYGAVDRKKTDGEEGNMFLVGGKNAEAIEDAFTHALNNPEEYEPGISTLFGFKFDENYNCYESSTSIAKGENVDKV